MRCFIKSILAATIVAASVISTGAFTLLGPAADWMTQVLAYDRAAPGVGLGAGAGVGGPMNLGDEYRWNVPTIYYGFSTAFYTYFGQRGIVEIEKAIKILNELPSMDTINVDDYPLTSQRINYQAQALGLRDVKSMTLSFLVEALGITDPTRYVFTIRNRYIIGQAPTNYFVIKRNFDPITWEPTSFINGQLWTYTAIIDNQNAPLTLAVNEAVDPLALQGLINAPVASGIPTGQLLRGGFWTGLTRDDVGGLRYIYRSGNQNVESAPANASTAGFGAVASGSGGSPWAYPVVTPPTTGTGTTTIPGGGTNFITTGLRPGIGRFRFVRVTDGGGFFVSNTVGIADQVIANGRVIAQNLVRPLQVPDIVFDGGDLQQGDSFNQGYQLFFNNQLAWLTNGASLGPGKYGPGVIPPSTGAQPSFILTLQTAGPAFANTDPFSLSEVNSAQLYRWAAFDGSTNAPFIFPNGASIQAVEDSVLGGSGGGTASSGSLVSVWTPSTTVLLPPGTTATGPTTGTGTTP